MPQRGYGPVRVNWHIEGILSHVLVLHDDELNGINTVRVNWHIERILSHVLVINDDELITQTTKESVMKMSFT